MINFIYDTSNYDIFEALTYLVCDEILLPSEVTFNHPPDKVTGETVIIGGSDGIGIQYNSIRNEILRIRNLPIPELVQDVIDDYMEIRAAPCCNDVLQHIQLAVAAFHKGLTPLDAATNIRLGAKMTSVSVVDQIMMYAEHFKIQMCKDDPTINVFIIPQRLDRAFEYDILGQFGRSIIISVNMYKDEAAVVKSSDLDGIHYEFPNVYKPQTVIQNLKRFEINE